MDASAEVSGGHWALRPRKVTEVVDLSGRLYRANILTLFRIMVPFALLAQAIYVLLALSALPNGAFVHSGTLYAPFGASTSGYTVAGLAAGFIQFLLIDVLALAAMFRVFSETILGHSAGAGAAVRLAASRFWALLGLSLLRGIVVAIGLLFLVVPGVWLYVIWAVAVPVLLLEKTGVSEALSRSRDLVRGRWWATFGALLLWAVIFAIAEIAISVLLNVILSDTVGSPTGYVLLQGLKRFIAEVLFAPFGAAVVTAIYFDLRVRNEAFDIEVMANHLAAADGRSMATAVGLGAGDDPGGPFAGG